MSVIEKLAWAIAHRLENHPHEEDERDAAEAVLSALNLTVAQAAALMDGSAVVVPVEPSAEMVAAMNGVWQDWPDLTMDRVASCRWAALMNAVHAASQQPEETRG